MYFDLSDVARDASPEARLEAELVAHVSLLRSPPFGELHRDADATWFTTGRATPHGNGVLAARLPEHDVDATIARILAPFAARAVPMMWWCFAPLEGVPPDVDRALRAAGLELEVDLPGMELDLAQFDPPAPPAGASIERVRDSATLAQWADIVGRAFDQPRYADGPSAGAFRAYGHRDDAPFRHYLCRIDGRLAGAAMLSLAAEAAHVAGLANVATLPEVRNRGVGGAVASAALQDARSLGRSTAVLSAGAAGLSLYEQLGFKLACRHLTYAGTPHALAPSPRRS